ncbi:MAG: DUF919 domain-containing protein [Planctomycetaceae bacterium]|jgi:hypothetical protein|nr:DUF919 domain-containing protein [Planctomycetaceae bacterium]
MDNYYFTLNLNGITLSIDPYIAGVFALCIVLSGPVAFVWCLILRRRLNDILERQEQLEINSQHWQRDLANSKVSVPKIELITLDSSGSSPNNNSSHNGRVKKNVPVVPFGEIDSFWQNESAVRQRKRLDSEVFSASQIFSAVPKNALPQAAPRTLPHTAQNLYVRFSFLRWLCLAAAIWGVAVAELYCYAVIGTDALYFNGVIFLVLACIAVAATVM